MLGREGVVGVGDVFVTVKSEVGLERRESVSGSHLQVGQKALFYTLHQQRAYKCLECDSRLQSMCLAQVPGHPSAVELHASLHEAAVFSGWSWCKRRDS